MKCFRCDSLVSSFDANNPTKPANAKCVNCGLSFSVCIFEIRAIHIRDFAKQRDLKIDTPKQFSKARDLMLYGKQIKNYKINEELVCHLIENTLL